MHLARQLGVLHPSVHYFKRMMNRFSPCIVVFLALGIAAPVSAAPDNGERRIQAIVQNFSGRDADVQEFYRDREFAPAWSTDNAGILVSALERAAAEGLNPKDYLLNPGQDADTRDVTLTRLALHYVEDVRNGRPGLRAMDDDVALPALPYDTSVALAGALKNHVLAGFLASAPPSSPQYAKLKSALAWYQAIRDRGGWPLIPADIADSVGENGPAAATLRERLRFEDPTIFADGSAGIAAALKRFQLRHGLSPDGVLGQRTRSELNVTAQARVEQIVANMERWRWLPRTFEPNYIAVNVPDATLSLVLNGSEVLRSRVVVGKPKTPTPILRAEGGGITVNPPWNVPTSIARKEILPRLKSNPSYLRSQDMVLLNGPAGDPYGLHVRWRDIPAGTFPYLIQQHPGLKNSLGTIKLELPNRFDVYLHDTPSKRAFAFFARDVSHGCVRVERILPLASYILSENLDAMMKIADAVSTGETRYFPFQRRIPVYFLYWTVFAGPEGTLQFRPDVYGRDSRMAENLSQPMRISGDFPNCGRG